MVKSKRKPPDAITNFEHYGNEKSEAIYHALKPLDAMASQMEMRWGFDRLPGLVSVETASKFGKAKAKLDQQIELDDVQGVEQRASVMLRAWVALDAEAKKLNAKQIDPDVWLAESDNGIKYGFVKSNADAHKVAPELSGVRVFNLDEVVRLIEHKFVGGVKDVFPSASVQSIKKRYGNDEIPF